MDFSHIEEASLRTPRAWKSEIRPKTVDNQGRSEGLETALQLVSRLCLRPLLQTLEQVNSRCMGKLKRVAIGRDAARLDVLDGRQLEYADAHAGDFRANRPYTDDEVGGVTRMHRELGHLE
jgi:hypothetical protein